MFKPIEYFTRKVNQLTGRYDILNIMSSERLIQEYQESRPTEGTKDRHAMTAFAVGYVGIVLLTGAMMSCHDTKTDTKEPSKLERIADTHEVNSNVPRR